MEIAFFGSFGSFDYFKIGGVESFSRRLAAGLKDRGHLADFVVYGAPVPHRGVLPNGIGIYYFARLKPALDFLAEKYKHVITIYLPPKDRLYYLQFRWLKRRSLSFHQVYAAWPDSAFKRQAAFLDGRIYPFNGRLFCISPRIWRHAQRWSDGAVLLLPPVAKDYFLQPDDKPKQDKIRITYIGRTEPGKGIEEVIQLFTKLMDSPEVELELHGFHHTSNQESVKIHEWLSRQSRINYFYTPYEGFSPAVEQNLGRILRRTDILVLPYRRLSSTMDTPVLLLEGMASLCAVLTRPMGDISALYGESPFIFSGVDELLKIPWMGEGKRILSQERRRILRRNQELSFEEGHVTDLLLASLS